MPPESLRTVLVLLLLLVAGCQTQVYLMPTPAPLQTGLADPFVTGTGASKGIQPRIEVFYATNRLALPTPNGKEYITLFDRKLRVGVATLRIGDENLTPEDLYRLSTTAARKEPIPIEIAGLGRGGHSFWYSSPWVSTDILIQLLLDKRPAERGLVQFEGQTGARLWTFPPDYAERLAEVLGPGE